LSTNQSIQTVEAILITE